MKSKSKCWPITLMMNMVATFCLQQLRYPMSRSMIGAFSRYPAGRSLQIVQRMAQSSTSTQQQPKKKKTKGQRKKECQMQSLKDKERNFHREQRRKLMRMKGLHQAAKWKRILSACQYWFSATNLKNDDFMIHTLRKYHGWIPITTLLTFPKFHHWTDAELLLGAFESTLGVKHFRVAYSRDLCQSPEMYNAQMLSDDWEANKEDFSIQFSSLDDKWNEYASDETDTFGMNESYEDLAIEEKEMEKLSLTQTFRGGEISMIQKHNPSTYDWGDVDDDDDELLQLPATSNVDVTQAPTSIEPQNLKFLDVEDDHDTIPGVALIRHVKITLEYLDLLEAQSNQELEEHFDFDSDELYGNVDATKEKEKKKKKLPSLPKYKSERPVVMVKKPSQLKTFCSSLLESTAAFAEKSKDSEMARCVGFDAEYCTLEEDIRGNLPALIQLASPAPDGPVGLIWIDKFPNHGRDVLTDNDCKPLRDIFGDSSLWKVGVMASGDARNLAKWFGARNTVHIFSGIGDLEHEETTSTDSLSDLCEKVLGKNLPKIKEKTTKAQSDRKKKGKRVPTAHWRRDGMTPLMKEYAANDAACSVDIWLKLKDL